MLDNFFADSTTEMGTNDVFVARLAASNKDLIFERPKSVEQLFKATSKITWKSGFLGIKYKEGVARDFAQNCNRHNHV